MSVTFNTKFIPQKPARKRINHVFRSRYANRRQFICGYILLTAPLKEPWQLETDAIDKKEKCDLLFLIKNNEGSV